MREKKVSERLMNNPRLLRYRTWVLSKPLGIQQLSMESQALGGFFSSLSNIHKLNFALRNILKAFKQPLLYFQNVLCLDASCSSLNLKTR